jgi:hypothetical protein
VIPSFCALCGGWRKRGGDQRSGSLFRFVDPQARVGGDYPLRTVRGIVNEAESIPLQSRGL